MERQILKIALTIGVFIASLITFAKKSKKYNEPVPIIIFSGSLAALTLLYLEKNPEALDLIDEHPGLTLVGVIISFSLLFYHIFKK